MRLNGKGKLALVGLVAATAVAFLGYVGYKREWHKKPLVVKAKEQVAEFAKKLSMRPEDLT